MQNLASTYNKMPPSQPTTEATTEATQPRNTNQADAATTLTLKQQPMQQRCPCRAQSPPGTPGGPLQAAAGSSSWQRVEHQLMAVRRIAETFDNSQGNNIVERATTALADLLVDSWMHGTTCSCHRQTAGDQPGPMNNRAPPQQPSQQPKSYVI